MMHLYIYCDDLNSVTFVKVSLFHYLCSYCSNEQFLKIYGSQFEDAKNTVFSYVINTRFVEHRILQIYKSLAK